MRASAGEEETRPVGPIRDVSLSLSLWWCSSRSPFRVKVYAI
jgi:hypothetical protein